MAKMDLELWMQEDGTNMFGAVLYSADIYDRGTAQRAAAHILVRPPALVPPSCAPCVPTAQLILATAIVRIVLNSMP